MVHDKRITALLVFLQFPIVGGLLLFGFWPFNFNAANEVVRNSDCSAITFGTIGIAFSETVVPNHFFPPMPLRLTIDLTPSNPQKHSISRIITFYDPIRKKECLSINQWKSHLIIRRQSESSDYPQPEIGVKNILHPDSGITHISILFGASETIVEGSVRERIKNRKNFFTAEKLNSTTILLGNSPTGTNPWHGSLRTITIAAVADSSSLSRPDATSHRALPIHTPVEKHLAIDFDSCADTLATSHPDVRIVIPTRFTTIENSLLSPPWKDFEFKRYYFIDIITNLLGFIPFGLFLMLLFLQFRQLRKMAALSTIVAGFTLSFIIELLQVHLPTRSSQLTDVLLNTAGTLCGILVAHLLKKTIKSYYLKGQKNNSPTHHDRHAQDPSTTNGISL